MDELKRTHFVIERFARLQGLRVVPLGCVFLASAAWRLGWVSLPGGPQRATAWFVAGVAVAIAVSFWIRGAYERTFGYTHARLTTSGAVPLLTVLVAFVILLWAEETRRWPVSVALLFLATCVGYTGMAQGGLRKHYLGVSAGIVALACLQLFGVPVGAREVALDVVVGTGLIVAGIGDDLVLRRNLQPPPSHTHASPA